MRLASGRQVVAQRLTTCCGLNSRARARLEKRVGAAIPAHSPETGAAKRVFPNGLKQRPQFGWRSDADGLDTSTAGSRIRYSTVALGKACRGTSGRALKNIGILLFRTKSASRVRSGTLLYNWLGSGLTHRHNGYRFFLRIQVPVNRLENLGFNDD
jgi:hypothetical protein